MDQNRKGRLGGLFIFFIVFCLFGKTTEHEDILVEGTGHGFNETEAVLAAKRDAVTKGITIVLQSQTEIENFKTKQDIVVTKTLGTVKKYELLSRTKSSEGIVTLTIKAFLSRPTLLEDLGAFRILLESMEKPKVMVVIQENNIGVEESTNREAEKTILSFLKSPYNFETIDPAVVASIKTSTRKMSNLRGDAERASSIGSLHGAEVLITGTALSRIAENISDNLGGMKSVQADVTLRAINCTTGRIISSGNAHGCKVHISPKRAGMLAINYATQKVIKNLLNEIIEDWNRQINNGLPLITTIDKVSSNRIKNAVIQTLRSLPGVVTVKVRSWDGKTKKLNTDIQYKGNTNGFCSKVDGYKMTTGGGSLAVTGQRGTCISIVIQAK